MAYKFTYLQERDLIDPRIDMMASAELNREKLTHLSPLYIATLNGNLQEVKRLIEEGLNPLDKDINDDTLLHFAAIKGELDILKYLVEDVECNPAMQGFRGTTTLHAAAQGEQFTTVKYLVEQCQLDPIALDHVNWYPLHYACSGGDLEVVRYLIECMSEYMEMEDILYDYSEFRTTSTIEPSDSKDLVFRKLSEVGPVFMVSYQL